MEQVAHAVRRAKLSKASLPVATGDGVIVRREGALPGAASWTHMYGDIANTVKSNDRIVRAPLGVLWFGGNSHTDVLPRHSHSPPEQVLGGRLFVEGMNSLSARDVYTGRVVWRREFPDLGTHGVYYDETYADTPLDPAYNQVHIPGANSRGTNFVVADQSVYLAIGSQCHVLDAASGTTTDRFELPSALANRNAQWTYVGVYNDTLFGGAGFAEYGRRFGYEFKPERRRGHAWSAEWFGTRSLVAYDRKTGTPKWHIDAELSFLHNGIVAGNQTLFLLDKLPKSVEDHLARRGQSVQETYRIVAVDIDSGALKWTYTGDVFGTWLGVSESHDLLIHAGAAAPDRALDEVGQGMIAIRATTGEVAWHNEGLEYAGPCIIHQDKIITNSRTRTANNGVYRLADGKPVMIENPFTGESQPWTYQRTHGCNTAVASEHLLTFRSGAAGFYDLTQQCGVGNLGGFRSGCTSNLIAADGVLNAPDFTRTCSCGYQNQTSLALIHMPEVERWSISKFDLSAAKGETATAWD